MRNLYPICENHSQTGFPCENPSRAVTKKWKLSAFLLFFFVAAAMPGRAQTNLALNATVARSGGGSGTYGPQHFNDGVIPAFGSMSYGWVADAMAGAWIEYTWTTTQTIGQVKFYLDDRPMNSCTIQYWSASENKYIDLQKYTRPATVTDNDLINLDELLTTTKLRFYNITNGGFNPNFREIQVFSSHIGIGQTTNPATCNGTDGKITITGLSANRSIPYSYTKDGVPQSGSSFTSNASGVGTILNLGAGTYTQIKVTDAIGTITFTNTVALTAPGPTINAVSNQTLCSGSSTSAVSFSGTNATSYTWTNNKTAIGLAASGTNNIASFNAQNTTSAPVTATISVTPVSEACTGTPTNFTITVNPAPAVANVSVPAGGTYRSGDNLRFTVNYTGNVIVNTDGRDPFIPVTLNTGGTVQANYVSGSGSSALVFQYTVKATDGDPDGITLGTSINLNGGAIQTVFGCVADNTLNNIPSTSAILVINQVAQTITFNAPAAKTYGDPDFDAAATASSELTVAYTSSNADVATIVDGKVHIVGAGTTTITASQPGNGDYFAASSVPQTLVVNPRNVTVAADTRTKVYGEADPALTYTYAPALVGTDAFSGSLSRMAGEDAGTYALNQGTLALDNNYSISYTGNNLTITAKAVTVTAESKTKVYGEADPALTYTVSPSLINGDAFTGSLSRTAGEDVGTYTVNQGTLALSNNYALTYAHNDLTVTPRTVTVTADTKSKVYGEADPALTYTVSPALLGNDAFTGSLSRTAGEDVGTYTVNQGALALSGNYTITYAGNHVTITPKAVTITADTKTKIYGEADPALTYTVSPALIAGDAFTGSLSRTAGENTGTYSISQGTLALNNNYTVSYADNNLTITQKTITVTAEAKSKVYGDEDPALTYTISPALIAGDVFTGILSRKLGENAGNYSIVQNTLALSGNYQLNYVAANLVIDKAVLTATAGNKTVCSGDAVAPVPVSYTGFRNGENASSISSEPVVNIPSNTAAGNYALTPSRGSAKNYSFHYVNGQLTVLPLPAGNITQVQAATGVVSGYQLTAPAGVDYAWSTGDNANTITVRASGNYSVTVTNQQGCSKNFALQVSLQAVSVPNTFSPNGDGINDYWLIPELKNYPSAYVTVVNRGGQVVFESRSFTRWDGKYNGRDLPAGVYFYRVRKAPGEEPMTGWLNLIK